MDYTAFRLRKGYVNGAGQLRWVKVGDTMPLGIAREIADRFSFVKTVTPSKKSWEQNGRDSHTNSYTRVKNLTLPGRPKNQLESQQITKLSITKRFLRAGWLHYPRMGAEQRSQRARRQADPDTFM